MLDRLNEQQREAVTLPLGPSLVLAGAGSGKTRVLTHRIAYLVGHLGEPPGSLLAVTFTNKAARQMRERAEELLGIGFGNLWIGTFHRLCNRILRAHAERLGLSSDFQILDAEDQKRMIKRVLREAGADEKRLPPRQIQRVINQFKENGLNTADAAGQGEGDPEMLDLYRRYQTTLARSGLVDFGDLLLYTLELFRQDPEVAAHYRKRFQHILVDEFQDTNRVQLRWLQALAKPGDDLFVVGDDDQSIYGWRGARVDHILQFQDYYPDCRVVRLEQNYRSTGPILASANDVIQHNVGRLGKQLWTQRDDGQAVGWIEATTERDEARSVVREIQKWVESGRSRAEIAVLYRSHAQSRQLEEALIRVGCPYRVYGGVRFFERAEIKDVLAYLRLLRNPHDDASFERVVNQPSRGVGDKTLASLRAYVEGGASLWDAARTILSQGALRGRARTGLERFLAHIESLTALSKESALTELVERILEDTGLRAALTRKGDETSEVRAEILQEFLNAVREFEEEWESNEGEPLEAFLTHAALEIDEGYATPNEEAVQLMSLHAAKGLEFPLVFIVGMEEGLFPHIRSLERDTALEEERRLCYVGMTRAMERLVLTMAQRRYWGGGEQLHLPSRFIAEIDPKRLIQLTSEPQGQTARAEGLELRAPNEGLAQSPFPPGANVHHPHFGPGVVMACEGNGPKARVRVFFRELSQEKWLINEYARLQRV